MRYLTKGLIYLATIALFLTLVGAFVLPTLLSTERGTKWLSQELSRSLNAEVKFEKLHLSLLGTQQIEGVQVKKAGEYHLNIARIDIPTALWKLPLPFCDLGLWRIEKPSYQFFASALESKENPPEPDSSTPSSFHPAIFFSRQVTIDIVEGKLACQNLDNSGGSEISPLSLHLQTQGLSRPATFELQGKTQASHGEGELTLHANIDNPALLAQTLKLEFALKQFPLDILTPFLPKPYDSLMRSWGEVPLQLQALVTRNDTYGDYSLNIQSKPLQGEIKFKENNGSFTLLQPATFDLTLSANELNQLLQSQAIGPQIIAEQTPHFKSQLKIVDFDLDNRQLANWSMDAEFNLGALALEHGAAKSYLGPISGSFSKHEHIQVKLSSKDPKSLALNLDATLGSTLDPQSLVSLALSASRLQSADLAIWYPLPLNELGWLFPASFEINIKKHASIFDYDLKALMGSSPIACHGTLDRHLLTLEHLDAKIPSLSLDKLTANQLSVTADHATCDLSDPLTSLDIKLEGRAGQLFMQNPPMAIDALKLQLKAQKGHFEHTLVSSLINSKGSWQLENQKLKLLQPLEINLQATQKQLEALAPTLPIAEALKVELRVDPNTWDIAGNLGAQSFKLHAKIQGLTLQKPQQASWKFADLSAQASSNFTFDQLAFAMNASPLFNDYPACTLALNGQCGTNGANAKFNVTKLPTSILDALANVGLSSLLGSEFNVDGNVIMQQGSKHLVANCNTSNLQLSAKLAQTATSDSWKLISPATLSCTLDANGYNVLDEFLTRQTDGELGAGASREDTLSLAKPAHLSLELVRLDLDDTNALPSFAGKFNLDSFQLIEKTSGRISSIDQLTATFERDAATDIIQAEAKAGFTIQDTEGKHQGPLALGLKLKNFLKAPTKNASPSQEPEIVNRETSALDQALIDLELTCKGLPSDILDLGLRWSSKSDLLGGLTLAQLIGTSSDLQVNTHLQSRSGPVALRLKSPYTSIELDGAMQEGVMSLKQAMKAQVELSPAFSRHLIDQMGISAKSGNPPFSLQVSEKDFSLPLLPLNPAGMHLSQAHLEIGQLEVPNKGNLNLALTLLRAPKASSSPTASLWFTPIDFSIDKGVVQIERIDILAADAFPLAFWGQADLTQEQAHLCLGITGQAFERALGVTNLPENYVMLFPIEGSFATAGIDMKVGAAKITSLLALKNQMLPGLLSLNPAAKLVVGAVQSKLPVPDGEAKVPPSRYPLPWPSEATPVEANEESED